MATSRPAAPARKPVASARRAAPAAKTSRATSEAPVRKSRTAPATPTARKKRAASVEEAPVRKTRRASAEEPVVRSRKKNPIEEAVEEMFNPYGDIDATLDAIEKSYGLTGASVSDKEIRQSTSSLALDLILDGGLLPGMHVFYGPEQSCKSTLAMSVSGACIESQVPICAYHDPEGSFGAKYLNLMLETQGLGACKDPLGIRDKAGNWVKKPLIRYYASSTAETFFDYVAKLERELPDKVLIGDDWYFVYENTKENQKRLKGQHDQKYLSRTGKLRVPAPNGSLQALIICDSLPALLPEKQDVDDPGSGMASQARMFSEQLKRVKGKMRSKRICFLAINQLRTAPMVMFGNPEYTPCGQAVKFFADTRLRMYPRALSSVPGSPKGKGQIETEPSVTIKGDDQYRYINVKTEKNKMGGTPGQEIWLRLWITDPSGDAHGFDPVFDTWFYLMKTGQIVGNRKAMKLNFKDRIAKKSITWTEFKLLIIGPRKAQSLIYESIGMKPLNLRASCKKQLLTGDGVSRYYNTIRDAAVNKGEDDGDAED